MIKIYERRQKELERIRAEGDRVMKKLWTAYYETLPFEEVDQLLNGKHPHGHKVIEFQSPEHCAAVILWRKKSEDSRKNLNTPSVNLRTLDVGGDVHNDDWRSKTPD